MKKYYIGAPMLGLVLEGPLKIGNIVKDFTAPQDRIAFLERAPANTIPGVEFSKGKIETARRASIHAGFSAKLYEVFGAQGEARGSRTMHTVYDFDEIKSLYLADNPTAKEIEALRKSNPEVKTALDRGPLYIVTGLKVVKGLKYTTVQRTDIRAGAGGQATVTEEAVIEAHLGGEHGTATLENYTVIGDTIMAFQVHIVAKEGRWWPFSSTLDSKTFDPEDGGLMNSKDSKGPADLFATEADQQHIAYFSEQEELGEVVEEELEDEDELWSLLVIRSS
ncbi:hypothetical protein BU24DRAFT_429002 [Aaosphaeria arxii CBS 175.79]|uniref:Uncharacterized protein n=1 Tax=Aaosphaeria arxii CBS 175.79 TaxID=1450172 RepID=A0A6A5X7Z7_9PLEO|nr:uncharacterized protein BU24DRAFT_429002 [Aaosphaeria arxii CBS 175.79]KAF2009062.1 hypothetical protein BU24DRAFT_429002 [Aaosphaeria arxii CBS 175.79]